MYHHRYLQAILTIAALCSLFTLSGQAPTPLPMQKPLPYYHCIDYSANRLTYPADSTPMAHFYSLLDTLTLFGRGNINIVHIGGSHIQADIMSNRMRLNFTQCLPGLDASRGMIFPYKAARTNNPTNYIIHYEGSWRKCQNSLPPIDRILGISGISISTDDRYATISFALNPENQPTKWQYQRLQLLASVSDTALTPVLIIDTDTIAPTSVSEQCTPTPDTIPSDSPTRYYTYTLPYRTDHGTIALHPTSQLKHLLHPSTSDTTHHNLRYMPYDTTETTIYTSDNNTPDTEALNIGLESDNASPITRHDITFPNTITDDRLFTINGIIPIDHNNGITYHSLGVNGASLPSWLRCTDFGRQIHLLKPDLVIMAIGVNDANVPYGRFSTTEYINNYNALIDLILNANPRCAIIFVTNNDCVLRTGRQSHGPNRNTALVAEAMTRLAQQHNAAVWDMYRIMGGLGSIAVWRDAGLANRDRVHFLSPGYTILGDMMYNAIIYDWLYK